jgi:NTP pyrophosphatase (non-canonical NTP hydrolase)
MSEALKILTEKVAKVSDVYAAEYNIDRSGDWHLLKLQEEMGELTQAYLTVTGRTRRPAGDEARTALTRELADVQCMLLLLARDEGIDMDQAVQEKWLSWLEKKAAS